VKRVTRTFAKSVDQDKLWHIRRGNVSISALFDICKINIQYFSICENRTNHQSEVTHFCDV